MKFLGGKSSKAQATQAVTQGDRTDTGKSKSKTKDVAKESVPSPAVKEQKQDEDVVPDHNNRKGTTMTYLDPEPVRDDVDKAKPVAAKKPSVPAGPTKFPTEGVAKQEQRQEQASKRLEDDGAPKGGQEPDEPVPPQESQSEEKPSTDSHQKVDMEFPHTTGQPPEPAPADQGAAEANQTEPHDDSPSTAMGKSTDDETKADAAETPNVDKDTTQAAHEDQESLHGPAESDQHAQEAEDPPEQAPVLTEDDEQFLHKATSDFEIPPPPSRRATMIKDNGDLEEEAGTEDPEQAEDEPGAEDTEQPKDVPLPDVSAPESEQLRAKNKADPKAKQTQTQTWKDRWNKMQSFVPSSAAGLSFATPNLLDSYRQYASKGGAKNKENQKAANQTAAADTLSDAAKEFRSGPEEKEAKETQEQSNRDLTSVLQSLNLSSINNRVVGISSDTQKLLESFNVVLKDIINGGPTAYNDLEKLLKDREAQLDSLFGNLPPFLQTLVKSVPTRMYAALAPQLAAAMASEKRESKVGFSAASTGSVTIEASETDDLHVEEKSGDKKTVKKKKSLLPSMPSLKSLTGEKGAVAAMLRSILGFLELRFPAFLTGTNALMSMAVFLLLFVFWYCHKRGKETRLLQSIELPTDPSLDDLERGTTLEKSAEELHEKLKGMETEKAAEVPLRAADDADLEAGEVESKASEAKDAQDAPSADPSGEAQREATA